MSGECRIPLADADLGPRELRAVSDVVESGRLALGPNLAAFESAMADYVGVEHVVAVNSGTSALHLILEGLGIGEGDEVITTSFSFIASANCILFVRATPVFVDIDPNTLCIDPEKIEAAITPRTKAILAVDVFGHPADWPALERIAAKHRLVLIEDSAESLGSELNGRRCGSFGRAGIFGFYPNKQITTGEGGMIVTDDGELARVCRSMANQGRGEGGDWLKHVRLGYNFRMDELSAALGVVQLSRIEEFIEARNRVASWYESAFADVAEVRTPTLAKNAKNSWFVYVVRLSEEFTAVERDAVLYELTQQGIGCRNYFAPIHLQPFYRESHGTREGSLPITEAVGARTIALPFFNRLSRDQVDRVAGSLVGAIDRVREVKRD
ncbi:DegT/DnrJ/EryC1/StrS family aminotransferase [Candidatus Bipolaricaulota bacterium]